MAFLVYTIIPVHNRKEFTRNCLRSLQRQTVSDRLRIIVVDDGSEDGTDEMLAAEFPEVIVLRGDGNLFWTAAKQKHENGITKYSLTYQNLKRTAVKMHVVIIFYIRIP